MLHRKIIDTIRSNGSTLKETLTLISPVPNIPSNAYPKWKPTGDWVKKILKKNIKIIGPTEAVSAMQYMSKTRYRESDFLHRHICRNFELKKIEHPAMYLRVYLNSSQSPCEETSSLLLELMAEKMKCKTLQDPVGDIFRAIISSYYLSKRLVWVNLLLLSATYVCDSALEIVGASEFMNFASIVVRTKNCDEAIETLCRMYLKNTNLLTNLYFVEAVTLIRHLPETVFREECLVSFSLEMLSFLSRIKEIHSSTVLNISTASQVILQLAISYRNIEIDIPNSVIRLIHELVIIVGNPEHSEYIRQNSNVNSIICWGLIRFCVRDFPDLGIPHSNAPIIKQSEKWLLLDDLLYRSSVMDCSKIKLNSQITSGGGFEIPIMGTPSNCGKTFFKSNLTTLENNDSTSNDNIVEFSKLMRQTASRCVIRFLEGNMSSHSPTDVRRVLYAASALDEITLDLLEYSIVLVERNSSTYQHHSDVIVRLVNAISLWKRPSVKVPKTTNLLNLIIKKDVIKPKNSNSTQSELLFRVSSCLNNKCTQWDLAHVWMNAAMKCNAIDLPVVYNIIRKWISGGIRLSKSNARMSLLKIIFNNYISRPNEIFGLENHLRSCLRSPSDDIPLNEISIIIKCIRKLGNEDLQNTPITPGIVRKLSNYNLSSKLVSEILRNCIAVDGLSETAQSEILKSLTRKKSDLDFVVSNLSTVNEFTEIKNLINETKK